MALSKKQAYELLGISEKTLQRRIKAGRYTCTRTGDGQYAALSFTYADLGLPEPVPEPTPTPAVAVVEAKPEPKVERVPDIREPDAFNPQEFTDSFGHTLTGNDHHKLFKTQEHAPQPSQSHMNPALLSDGPNEIADVPKPWDGDGYTRRGIGLAAGYSQEQYDKDMSEWNRTHFGAERLSMSEQREAQERSKAAIAEAFNTVKR